MNQPQYGEKAQYGPNDVCYRHPRSPSFTLCQRCGKTICVDCQIQAPVGLLCPDCQRELQPPVSGQVARKLRTTGRKLSSDSRPIVSYTLIGLCVLLWLGTLNIGALREALIYAPIHSTPFAFEPWRMITTTFLHATAGPYHLLGNMVTLLLFGPALERALGKLRFILLFLLSGWGGSIAVMLWSLTSINTLAFVPVVGASGATFGILAATVVVYKRLEIDARFLLVLLAINLGIGFLPGNNISWQAHVGGLLVGAVLMSGFARGLTRNSRAQWFVCGSVILASFVLCGLYYLLVRVSVG